MVSYTCNVINEYNLIKIISICQKHDIAFKCLSEF